MPSHAPAQRSYQDSWLDYLQDYISENPRLAAAIAFQIGIIAGAASKNAGQIMKRSGATTTLMEALPSSIAGFLPLAGMGAQTARRRTSAAARPRSRKTARRRKQA